MFSIIELTEFLKANESFSYLFLFLGSYFETLIGPGFFIHGEIFFLSGSILAGLGYLNIWLVFLFSVLGGVLGDNSSYFLGRKYGKKVYNFLFKPKNKYLNPRNFKKGENFFKKYGDKSVFFARLLGPVSWVTPFLAGIFNLKYSKFFMYNLIGVITGISQFIAMGYLIGFSYLKVLSFFGRYYLLALLLIILIIILIYKTSGKRHIIQKLEAFVSKQIKRYGIAIGIVYVMIYILIIYFISSLF